MMATYFCLSSYNRLGSVGQVSFFRKSSKILVKVCLKYMYTTCIYFFKDNLCGLD